MGTASGKGSVAPYSKPAQVRISVIDINEYAPTFLQPSYTVQMDEGRLYKEIVRLEAVDKDCTPLFGDVCKYEILQKDGQTDGLFDINAEGAIRNVQPLSFKKAHNHILSVIAFDCAMKASAPVMVNIKVNRVCEARLTGVPERIDYVVSKQTPATNGVTVLYDLHPDEDDAPVVLTNNAWTFHAPGCN